MNEVSAGGQKADIGHGHVAVYLTHPLFVRMRRDAGDVDAPGREVHEEQNVVRHQPTLSPHLRGEEVRRCKDVHMRADELRSGGGLLSLRGRRYAVTSQNVADGLVTHLMPEVG